jgi:glycosyltransferase involved in cell wall biosynthesis
MKIAHIATFPINEKPNGGVSMYINNIVAEQKLTLSDEIVILCEKDESAVSKNLSDNVQLLRCFNKDLRFIFQIARAVHQVKPDIIHFQHEPALFGGFINSLLLPVLIFFLQRSNCIITIHGVISQQVINKKFISENNSSVPIWLVRMVFQLLYIPYRWLSIPVIVHERIFKHILNTEYGVPEHLISHIPLGVEDVTPVAKVTARSRVHLPAGKKIILYMGYLTGRKGIELLINGFAQYSAEHSDAYLVLGCGKHPAMAADANYTDYYTSVQKAAQKSLKTDSYQWVGFIPEDQIGLYYSAADVCIFPYTAFISSSGPMAYAIGYECPFLASDVFADAIEEQSLLFKRNPEALAKKITEFFTHQKQFHREVVSMKKQRTYAITVKKMYQLYKSLL